MDNVPLGKLHFYWRMSVQPNVPPNVVPDFVDFEFSFVKECQLLVQTRNTTTLEYLRRIYQENYNVGYLQEGHALAEGYGGDFLTFIERALSLYHPAPRSIAEIGAGGCYILKKLKERGYAVAAVDPSPIAVERGREFGIPVIPTFYPGDTSIGKVDVILHYDVLEHVSDARDFLAHHARDVNPGGLIAFAVPDCSPYIAFGDVSMVLHEHLNYFDEESLQNVVEAAGFTVLEIRPGRHGGVLHCVARLPRTPSAWSPRSGKSKFEGFAARAGTLRRQISDFIADALLPGHTLGCYVPLRALPYLSMLGVTTGCRFFDDNPGIYGQYFDGFPIPVENMRDLTERPVSHMLILSFAFGERIRNRIREALPEHAIRFFSLSDMTPVPAAGLAQGVRVSVRK